MRIELSITDDTGNRTIELPEVSVNHPHVLGRSASTMIASAFVEAEHCAIYANQGNWWIMDRHSRTGTIVNGQRVTFSAHELREGDLIRLGIEMDAPRIRVTKLFGAVAATKPADDRKSLDPLADPSTDPIEAGVGKFVRQFDARHQSRRGFKRVKLPAPAWLALAGVWVVAGAVVWWKKSTAPTAADQSVDQAGLIAVMAGETHQPIDVDTMIHSASFGRVDGQTVRTLAETLSSMNVASATDRSWQTTVEQAREAPLEKSIWTLNRFAQTNPYSHHSPQARELVEIGSDEWCVKQVQSALQQRAKLAEQLRQSPGNAGIERRLADLNRSLSTSLSCLPETLDALDPHAIRRALNPAALEQGRRRLLESLARIEQM
jgi:hypothetical protein